MELPSNPHTLNVQGIGFRKPTEAQEYMGVHDKRVPEYQPPKVGFRRSRKKPEIGPGKAQNRGACPTGILLDRCGTAALFSSASLSLHSLKYEGT